MPVFLMTLEKNTQSVGWKKLGFFVGRMEKVFFMRSFLLEFIETVLLSTHICLG